MSLPEFVGASAIKRADPSGGTGLTTGATLTISLDGAAFGAPTNTPAHVANGFWRVQLTAGERTSEQVDVQVTHPDGVPETRSYLNRNPDGGKVDTATTIGPDGITAGSIAAGALNGKGDWNIGKTGYSLLNGSIVAATFATDAISAAAFSQAAADKAKADVSALALETTAQAIKTTTDKFTFTAGSVDANVDVWQGTAIPAGSNMIEDNAGPAWTNQALKNAPTGGAFPVVKLDAASEASIPDSGSGTTRVQLFVTDIDGKPVDPDGQVAGIAVAAQNESDVNRSTNLGTVTRRAVGDYYVDYTIASAHDIEFIQVQVNATVSGTGYFDQSVIAIGMPKNIGKVNGTNVTLDDFQTLNASTVAAVSDAVGARTPEPGSSLTYDQSFQILNASQAGKTNGGGTTNFNIRNIGDTKNRIAAVVDSNGNRSAVTISVD